jgi:hypothetical protein
MARTSKSIERENELKAAIPAAERRLRSTRFQRIGIPVAAAAIVDAFSSGSITNFYNKHILSHIDVYVPTAHLVESRLAVAGLYTAISVIGAIRQNGNQAHIDHLQAMAAGEAQSDRLATAIEQFTAGQPLPEALLPGASDSPA